MINNKLNDFKISEIAVCKTAEEEVTGQIAEAVNDADSATNDSDDTLSTDEDIADASTATTATSPAKKLRKIWKKTAEKFLPAASGSGDHPQMALPDDIDTQETSWIISF